MTKLNNLKKSKKGFTLVEVIVVLVIIAILIAIAVPSLTGYITKAKNQALMADARTVLVAAQTVASENFAKGEAAKTVTDGEIKTLTGDGITGTTSDVVVAGGKVKSFTYTQGTKVVTYSTPNFTVTA